MTSESPETAADAAPKTPPKTSPEGRSAALERLRDRTDELELIISSLTTFALFSLPGWLFNTYADVYTHLSTSLLIAGLAVSTLLAGFCYGLGACFVVHLMARAYWVGLIGLRAAFPGGINWQRTPMLGPHTKKQYRESLPALDEIITQTDRLASSLFAVISMLTLTMLWFGAVAVLTSVAAGTIGSRFGVTNAATGFSTLALLTVFVGIPLLIYLLDVQLAKRVSRLAQSKRFARLIGVLRRIAGFAYPQRLVLPVQLTLQSNTRPVIFFIAIILAGVATVVGGSYRVTGWRDFTLSDEFVYLSGERVRQGFQSAFYEDMDSPKDRLRAWPRVSSFTQTGSFVRLFLPYQPLRDNIPLQGFCGEVTEDMDPVDCIKELWTVSIEGQEVPMSEFIVAERMDIRMRGLIGLVPLTGLAPGMHRIQVTWTSDPRNLGLALDDRYGQATNEFNIPIVFSPDYERALESAPDSLLETEVAQ
jgi:hypothetical protein